MSLEQQVKKSIINQYQKHEGDTGSPAVQIALLSQRINDLTGHFKLHVKDHSSRRGLIKLVNQRRQLLSYLRKTDLATYQQVIEKLGIRG